ncbi:MAG: alpha/beta hydrolase [Anaerolineales bacterium]|nr:alpha/beta hydrolase [Anaerolineales bacterium]
MPYFSYNTQQLFYAHHKGNEKRPSLLLIHGAGGNRTHWPKTLRPLADYETFVLDLPGHGRSALPGCTTIDAYAAVVTAFINHLARPLVLIGHSMGGGIVQTIAAQHNLHVVAQVLIGTSPRLPVGAAILDNALHNPPQAIAFIAKYAWSDAAPQTMMNQTHQALAEVPPTVLHSDFTACNQFDMTERLGTIQLPTLVISGSEDKMTPAKYGRFLADMIPNAQYSCLEGVGHFIMLEQPNQTAALIKQFLEQRSG